MMVLKHKNIEKEFIFDRTTQYILCIENAAFLRKIIFQMTSNPEENDFLLYEKDKEQKFDKNVYFIENPLNLIIDEKKLNTTIQKDVATSIDSIENEKYLMLLNEINDYLEFISYDYPLRLSYDSNMALQTFLKNFSLSYEPEKENMLVSLSEQIKILSEIFKFRVFVFLNLFDFMMEEELLSFLEEMKRQEVDVLILSTHLPSYKIPDAFIVRIDQDLCELHIDSNS